MDIEAALERLEAHLADFCQPGLDACDDARHTVSTIRQALRDRSTHSECMACSLFFGTARTHEGDVDTRLRSHKDDIEVLTETLMEAQAQLEKAGDELRKLRLRFITTQGQAMDNWTKFLEAQARIEKLEAALRRVSEADMLGKAQGVALDALLARQGPSTPSENEDYRRWQRLAEAPTVNTRASDRETP